MNKFLQEIHEQPKALKDTLAYYAKGKGKIQLEEIVRIWKEGSFSHIIFTGMGSSFFAPQLAMSLLSNNGIPAYIVNAGELLHYHFNLIKQDTLLVCISQSGESYEIVQLLDKLPTGKTYIAITNEEESTLAKQASVALISKAGNEEMTSTKTYVSTLLILYLFANSLVGKSNDLILPQIENAVGVVTFLIENNQEWLSGVMDFLGQPSFIQLTGRGASFATVQQSALMFKEGAGCPAAATYGGEFRHGPMEMVREGFRAIVFAPLGETYTQTIKLANDIASFGGRVILITNSPEIPNQSDIFPVMIPCPDEFLFSIPATVPLQLIVNKWALKKGNVPGSFTRGAKVTVIE